MLWHAREEDVMAQVTSSSATQPSLRGEDGDLFNSQLVWFVIVLMVLFTLATVAGIAAIYYGDDIVKPAWGSHSVPPPTTN